MHSSMFQKLKITWEGWEEQKARNLRISVVSIRRLKAAGYKVYTHKSTVFLYPINDHLEFEIKQTLTTWRETREYLEKHHGTRLVNAFSWTFQPSPATS